MYRFLSHPSSSRVGNVALFRSTPTPTIHSTCTNVGTVFSTILPSFTPTVPSSSSFPSLYTSQIRYATSKSGGSTKNGRDSKPKFLGIKKYGGERVEPGNIILRQRGAKFGIVESTQTVAFGRDFTVYALKPGYVKFWYHALKGKSYVEIVKNPPTVSTIEKYPIVHLKKGDLPLLHDLVEKSPNGFDSVIMSDDIKAKLLAYREDLVKNQSSGGINRKKLDLPILPSSSSSSSSSSKDGNKTNVSVTA